MDRPLKKDCKCRERLPKGVKSVPSIFDTQRKDIRALFDIQEKKKAKRSAKSKR